MTARFPPRSIRAEALAVAGAAARPPARWMESALGIVLTSILAAPPRDGSRREVGTAAHRRLAGGIRIGMFRDPAQETCECNGRGCDAPRLAAAKDGCDPRIEDDRSAGRCHRRVAGHGDRAAFLRPARRGHGPPCSVAPPRRSSVHPTRARRRAFRIGHRGAALSRAAPVSVVTGPGHGRSLDTGASGRVRLHLAFVRRSCSSRGEWRGR